MSKLSTLLLLLFVALFVNGQSRKYNVGRAATAEEIQARDISVTPEGKGLPLGQGTAKEGRTIYVTQCAACHGEKGEGGAFMPIAGGMGSLSSGKPLLTVGSYWPYSTTVWDYINRAMPYQNPGSLKPDEVYQVTAYVLYLNKLIEEEEILNAKTLPQIKMPNRDGFIADPRPDVGPSVVKTQK
jgi:cytochrome c